MIATELAFRPVTIEDKAFYNHYFSRQKTPNSDYCFTVVQTWLVYGGAVEAAEVGDHLLLLKYTDVLDLAEPLHNYVLIGEQESIQPSHVDELVRLATLPGNKVIVTQAHKSIVESLLPEGMKLQDELGLQDYVYSVDGYASLNEPMYRRIRREISVFNRDSSGEVQILELDLSARSNKELIVNNHHMWDDTYQYANDPERIEGLIMQRTLINAEKLGVQCAVITVDKQLEGFLIYTEVESDGKRYADIHHARFSYRYRYLNDLSFHLFAKLLKSRGFAYINFERDADIPGLREHKLMLKPVLTLKAYCLTEA